MRNFDILERDLPIEDIMCQLYRHDIECFFVDFFPDEIMWISGCNARSQNDIANALHVPCDVVHYDSQHMFCLINLWKLRAIRRGIYLD